MGACSCQVLVLAEPHVGTALPRASLPESQAVTPHSVPPDGSWFSLVSSGVVSSLGGC